MKTQVFAQTNTREREQFTDEREGMAAQAAYEAAAVALRGQGDVITGDVEPADPVPRVRNPIANDPSFRVGPRNA